MLGLLVLISCLRSPPSQPRSPRFGDCLLHRHQRPYGHNSEQTMSAMEEEHMVHSDSVSPQPPQDLVEALPGVGVKDLPDRGFNQTFLADPHNVSGSARSVQLPPLPADSTHHQVVISWQLSPSLHQSIQDIQPEVYGSPYARTWCLLWTVNRTEVQ